MKYILENMSEPDSNGNSVAFVRFEASRIEWVCLYAVAAIQVLSKVRLKIGWSK